MVTLVLQIMFYVFAVYLVGLALRWWSKRDDAHASGILWAGIATLITTSVVFLNSIFGYGMLPSNKKIITLELSKKVEFDLIWAGAAVFCLFALWRVSEIISEVLRLEQIKKSAWGSVVGAHAFLSGDEELRSYEKTRILLQEFVRDETKNDRVILRWSSRIQLPFTVGFKTPSIYVPLWALRKDSGAHIEQLLSHECEHIKSNHHLWMRFLRQIFFIFPFFGPILRAIRHAFEAESDRNLINKLDDDAKEQYVATLESVIAPASGSGLEVGLGHDRRNIPLRIKQAFAKPAMRWEVLFGGAIVIIIYAATSFALGAVNLDDLGKNFNRDIPANYYIMDNHDGVKFEPIIGSGGVFGDGLYINTEKCVDERPVVVSIVRETDLADKWDGYSGEINIMIKKTNKKTNLMPYLVGTSYCVEMIDIGAHRNKIIDKDLVEVVGNGIYRTSIVKTLHPGDRSGVMTWEVNIPRGCEVWLTDFKLSPNSGRPRPSSEVYAAQVKHRSLMGGPERRGGFDRLWDLEGRPFFAD